MRRTSAWPDARAARKEPEKAGLGDILPFPVFRLLWPPFCFLEQNSERPQGIVQGDAFGKVGLLRVCQPRRDSVFGNTDLQRQRVTRREKCIQHWLLPGIFDFVAHCRSRICQLLIGSTVTLSMAAELTIRTVTPFDRSEVRAGVALGEMSLSLRATL